MKDAFAETCMGETCDLEAVKELIEDYLDENDILLYPNPASDVLNVSFVNGCEILIYNTLGQIVYQDKVVGDEVRVDTHAFAPGTYFVQVKGEKNCVKRFVVK